MMKKYSFKEFLTKETFVGTDAETSESINAVISKIEIPMIQRDYAQGRSKPGKAKGKTINDTGSRFIKSIFNSLIDDQKQEMELEFIYGSIEARSQQGTKIPMYVYIPLDGQQRLTTLFLLYWYFGMCELQAETEQRRELLDILGKFTYLTRLSSRIFCESICDFEKMKNIELDKAPSEILSNCPWYYNEYKKDPTVSAMMMMLDHIHNLYVKRSNPELQLLPRMEKLRFYAFPLNEYKLTEDLYIKMNARGKQLSNYENFKADLINWMRSSKDNRLHESVEYRDRMMPYFMAFAQKLDNEWTDIFWNSCQRNDDEQDLAQKVDDMFMTFFYRFFLIDKILSLDKSDVASNEVVKYFNCDESNITYNNNDFENIYEKCLSYEALKKIENFLDRISPYIGIENEELTPIWERPIGIVNEELTPIWERPNGEKRNIFDTKRLTFAPRLVFQAIFEYFCAVEDINEDKLRDWISVAWKFAVDPLISNFKSYILAVRFIDDELKKGASDILPWLCKQGESQNFKTQFDEERIKANLIAKDAEWKTLLAQGEQHSLLKGRISCLLPNGVETTKDLYSRYLEVFRAFDLNDAKRFWIRALLAKINKDYVINKELGLSNDHENIKVYINGDFLAPMHALLADIDEYCHRNNSVEPKKEKVLQRMKEICEEYKSQNGPEWVYPLVVSLNDDKNMLADYTEKRKIVVRDNNVYLCYKARLEHDNTILLNGARRNEVIKELLKDKDVALVKDDDLYNKSGEYFFGIAVTLIKCIESVGVTIKYIIDATNLRLYIVNNDDMSRSDKLTEEGTLVHTFTLNDINICDLRNSIKERLDAEILECRPIE